MNTLNEKYIDDLGGIIKALADVWPNDRENVMVAGAAFESFVGEMEPTGVQINKLIDLSWKGMRHLFEEDAYFISVKNATMQGVNTIREFLLSGGKITVEEFEHSCDQLDSALQGASESADKIIELDENGNPLASESQTRPVPDVKSGAEDDHIEHSSAEKTTDETELIKETEEITLNNLAARMMEVGDDAEEVELKEMKAIIQQLVENEAGKIADQLRSALDVISGALANGKSSEWHSDVSDCIEAAMSTLSDEEWELEQSEITDEQNPLSSEMDSEAPQEESVCGSEAAEESETEPFVIPLDVDPEMLKEFVAECYDQIEKAESALLDLEENPEDSELINTVFRAFHTIKGTSAFMGLDPLSEFTHSAETLLDLIRDNKFSFDRASADISLDSIDIIKKLLSIIKNGAGGSPLPKSNKYLTTLSVLVEIADNGMSPEQALAKLGLNSPVIPEFEDNPEELAPKKDLRSSSAESIGGRVNGAVEKSGQKNNSEATVRVNLGRLDRLIDMVGELVIAHSVVSQDNSITKDVDLMKKVDHTSKILRELQDTSLALRMVPLKATFHKMNRLVRDLARKAGKNVKLSTIGDETEIDRNMVDIINEPLVHMLRNSIDHGLETPDQRAESGKSTTANVWMRAYQEGGKVVIEIEDDGKGINKKKILKKAIEKGLIPDDQKLTDNEICGLIFHPGLSSVDKVTDLSGRGVGMDVVRRSIEQLKGEVEVESIEGQGTKVSLELPFTLAITDGMLVRVGNQKFILPTINIDMTFRARKEDIFTIMGSSEQVKYHGNSVPVLRLHRLFNISDAIEELDGATLIVIKNNNKLYALLVDEILGQQQLVGKSINMNVKMPHISGGAILGDGKVGLILDTAAIVM